MAEIVRMPKLSDTMTEGVVAVWHKKVGDKVSSGDLLADIETDKATMEFESFYDGVLLHIGVEQGKSAPVNEVLAIIGAPGTDVAALLASNGSAPAAPKAEVADKQPEVAIPAPAASTSVVDLSKFKAEVVRMPKLSDTMTDGVVAAWHKKVGDTVASGDLLAEIETDKATMEFESFYDGILLHIGVEQGKSAPVNSILAIIGEKGTDVAALIAAVESGASATPAISEVPKPVAAPTSAPTLAPVVSPTTQKTAEPHTTTHQVRVNISPLARKMAEECLEGQWRKRTYREARH